MFEFQHFMKFCRSPVLFTLLHIDINNKKTIFFTPLFYPNCINYSSSFPIIDIFFWDCQTYVTRLSWIQILIFPLLITKSTSNCTLVVFPSTLEKYSTTPTSHLLTTHKTWTYSNNPF